MIFFGFQKLGKLLGPEADDFRVWQRERYSMAAAYEVKKDVTAGKEEVDVAAA